MKANNSLISSISLRSISGCVTVINVFGFGLVLGLAALQLSYGCFLLRSQRASSAAESAAIQAARDLTRVFINDEKWGYVSLTENSADAIDLRADDGSSLPVSGINSVLAAVRTEKLLAQELKSENFGAEADLDYLQAKHLCNKLSLAFSKALSKRRSEEFYDLKGRKIRIYEDSLDLFMKNIPDLANGNARIVDFKIQQGWLADGASTTTPLAERAADSQECYKGFCNYPVGTDEFYFAGISTKARRVDPRRFRMPDSKHFSSAILVDAELEYGSFDRRGKFKGEYRIHVTAAALPCAKPKEGISGTLALHFPQGYVPELSRLKSLLSVSAFQSTSADLFCSKNGDFPIDKGSSLSLNDALQNRKLAGSVARAICDWIQSSRATPRLAQLVEAMETPFPSISNCYANTLLLFDFDRDGKASCRLVNEPSFEKHLVSDKQEYSIAYRVLSSTRGVQGLAIRNQVNCRAAGLGGKHAGRPLAWEYSEGGLCVAIEVFLEAEGASI
ncbi:MAG: hypothetical protein K2X27_10955 [Candidatus Obscuribacterales bacterium]|nr:hypothetical protein [Candidatus Obscuribacterales bacterium]